MNSNEKMPNGWEIASVQDIADVIIGQSPPSSTYNQDGIGLPFFQGKAEFADLHPVVEKWCSKPNKIAESNDILLSVRAPVGATNIADRKCCIGRGLAAIRYHQNHKFLHYFFRFVEKELDKKGTGTTFRAISGDVIRNTKLIVPPLPEQHRIVAKIEELFSSLDKGIESLKTAQQQLKIYRQAVLKWAFEGKLTNKNVVEGELPKGWNLMKLGEISEMCLGKMLDKAKNKGKLHPYLRNINVRWGTFDLSDLIEMRFEEFERERYSLKKGDLVICEGGEPGRCAIWTYNELMYIQKALHRVRMHNGYDARYISNYIFFSALNGCLEEYFTGTTIKHLTGKELKKVIIPIPSTLEEQNTIVAEIESRLSVCDKIEETIEQGLKQAEALRQSILKKAFEGRLVPQDPNDEPAGVLLERIREEREKAAGLQKKTRSRT